MHLPNYDRWLESPYTDAPEAPECPRCGEATLEEDKADRSVECTNDECDYADGYDWDAEAERRAETKAEWRNSNDLW